MKLDSNMWELGRRRGMEKVLTIIVPSYNTQDYIDQCIPTMLDNPYTDRLELMLVNDGSNDGTLGKLEWYGRHYPNTVTILDKENGGHGSVINIGIKRAAGKYLKVVDGDDWVIPEKLGKMICQLERCDADMVIHPYIRWNAGQEKETLVYFRGKRNHIMPFDKAAPGLAGVEIQAITYKTKMLRDNHIQVREKCFYEDTEYDIYPVRHVETVCICSYPVYVYCVGTQVQSVNPVQAFRNRKMHHLIVQDCINYYKQNARQLSLAKRQYISRIIRKRIRSHYMIYLKNRITDGQLEELVRWDEALKRESAYFYYVSKQFPVSFLRLDIRRTYPFVRLMYQFYEMLQCNSVLIRRNRNSKNE